MKLLILLLLISIGCKCNEQKKETVAMPVIRYEYGDSHFKGLFTKASDLYRDKAQKYIDSVTVIDNADTTVYGIDTFAYWRKGKIIMKEPTAGNVSDFRHPRALFTSSKNIESTTPSVSFTLPSASRKVFEQPQSKTDTVKGWVRYWLLKDEGWYGAVNIIGEDTANKKMLFDVARTALAIYDGDKNVSQLTIKTFTDGKPHPYDPQHGYLLKIIYRNGMEFDLSKHYEFLRDDEIVK